MKNEIVIQTFAEAVKAKVAKAEAIGTKTTWGTDDHLAALAMAIAKATDPEHDDAYVASIKEVLEDGYNVSQFQQTLEKAFAAKGHFQRSGGKKQTASALYAALGV